MKSALKKIIKFIAFRGALLSWILLFSLLLATLGGWYFIKTSIEESAAERFNVRVNEIIYNIQKRMTAYKQVLLGGSALFASSDSVTRHDWYTYIRQLKIEDNYPGILGIGYTSVVNPNNVEYFEKKIQAEGFPKFRVWPKTNNELITSIIYLEPFTGRNLRAFGYDMFSEPIRRNAMTEALEKGKASVSGKVKLMQETDKDIQPGFLMYVPFYQRNTELFTMEQKRKALAGFVYSPFRMRDLMNGILGEIHGISLEIYDGTAYDKTDLMYKSIRDINREYLEQNALFKLQETIYVEGHSWGLEFTSLPSFEASIEYGRSNVILITGIIISLLLFMSLRSMAVSELLSRQLEQLLNSSGEGIYGLDLKGNCTFINRSAAEMLGYTPEECLDKDMHELVHHSYDDGKRYDPEACSILKSLKDGKERRIEDEVFWRKDNSCFHVQYFANPIITRGEIKGAVVTFNDITERIKQEEAVKELAKRHQETLESITDAFYTLDFNLQFTYVNKEAERLLLKSRDELMGKNIWNIFPEARNSAFYPCYNKVISENIAIDFEEFYPPLNMWFEVHVYPSKFGITVIFRDVTENKEAREKIEASLKEKDVLLKEIHHRVKNNLQIIASLLNLQLQNLEDESVIEILKESQNRIKSMALIHEKLYMAKNVSKINFDNYVKDLVGHLLRSYSAGNDNININLKIEEINIDIDKTISLGLALNELISNSLKHAFIQNNGTEPQIFIAMWRNKKNVTLVLSDNGKGFPDSIDFKQTSSLGLQLVNALIQQLEGDIELDNSNGTKFTITFPV